MKKPDKIDKEALLELYLDYDNEIGHSPESPYEGQALYEFLLFKQGELVTQFEDFSAWLERSDKYLILLEKRERETKDVDKREDKK